MNHTSMRPDPGQSRYFLLPNGGVVEAAGGPNLVSSAEKNGAVEITEAEYTAARAELVAGNKEVIAAVKDEENKAKEPAYKELVKLGLTPAAAEQISGHKPHGKPKAR